MLLVSNFRELEQNENRDGITPVLVLISAGVPVPVRRTGIQVPTVVRYGHASPPQGTPAHPGTWGRTLFVSWDLGLWPFLSWDLGPDF